MKGDMNRPGIRQINADDYNPQRIYTPQRQQEMESHVLVPLMIAFVVSIFTAGLAICLVMIVAKVLDGFSERPLMIVNFWSITFVLLCWSLGFLSVFMWRIGVADALLQKLEELFDVDIDGDGAVGFSPRSVKVTSSNGTREVAVPSKQEKLNAETWGRIAIALLNECQAASRRGLCDRTKTVKITQGEANQALDELTKAGLVKDNQLTGEGWDWLIVFLPEHVQCLLDRPIAPPTTPPTLLQAG